MSMLGKNNGGDGESGGGPQIMGILNVTPDSFSDGGKYFSVEKAVERGLEMIAEGADIIDIGGESTGPGSVDVSVDEELRRVLPVVQALAERRKEFEDEARAGVGVAVGKGECDGGCGCVGVRKGARSNDGVKMKKIGWARVLLSVDTYKADVAEAVLKEGVDMINDVTALRGDARMAEVLAKYDKAKIVLMYSKDTSARTTLDGVHYRDVVMTVRNFLQERIDFAVSAGIPADRIIVDPGMGAFVSSEPKYSFELLNKLSELKGLGCPILVGASRKSFIRKVLGLEKGRVGHSHSAGGVFSLGHSYLDKESLSELGERNQSTIEHSLLEGNLACAGVAMQNGASILRVHDVLQTRRFIDMMLAISNS